MCVYCLTIYNTFLDFSGTEVAMIESSETVAASEVTEVITLQDSVGSLHVSLYPFSFFAFLFSLCLPDIPVSFLIW